MLVVTSSLFADKMLCRNCVKLRQSFVQLSVCP